MSNKASYTVSHELPFLYKNGFKALFAKVDITSLALFRIAFGAIMFIEVLRYFDHNWIKRYWIDPPMNFPYWPFLDLKPLPGDGMYYVFIVLGILSLLIMFGCLYRINISLFFLVFTYTYLLEQARYLNHFYLIILLSFILIWLPAHKKWSLDAKWRSAIKSEVQPLWSLWLLRFMIGLPFFFGGIAKLNSDWLVGQPLGIWLANDTDLPFIGPLLTEHWFILIISYSGLLLDLLIVPLLLYKPTRVLAFFTGLAFHLLNASLFTIGIFPWFMIIATTLYFAPSWPRIVRSAFIERSVILPRSNFNTNTKLSKKQRYIVGALGIWVSIMVLYPLRHLFIPGNPSWTEGGHKYAWHMKLRDKDTFGTIHFQNESGSQTTVIELKDFMTSWQAQKVLDKPVMLWQFAHRLDQYYKLKGEDIKIYANIKASLNNRPLQQFIDPNVDLTEVPYPVFGYASWIVPLQE